MLLLVCTGSAVAVATNWDRISAAFDDQPPTNDPTGDVSAGWDDCVENPDTCNSGERLPGGHMVWIIDGTPSGYFPWSVAGGTVQTLQAVSGILPHFGQFMPSGAYQYNLDVLAEEPQIVSEDPLRTVWKLNPDAVWDDGSPISADDVIITWRMSTPEADGYCTGCQPRAPDLLTESIESSDGGKTVTITYKDGVANPEWFAEYGTQSILGGIAPAHVAAQQGWDIDNPEHLGEYFEFLDTNPPAFSGGPYLIESFDLDTQVVKVPNPNWYGEVQPTLDELVIQFLPDQYSWVPALQNGELHGGSPSGWDGDVIQQLQEQDGVLLHMQSGPVWEHVDLNLANEWLGDVELRRAIFTVIDAADIAERTFGGLFPDYSLRTNHILPSDHEYHVDHLSGTGQGTGDVELARQILAAAGYEGYEQGAGQLTRDGEQIGPFRLRTTDSPARVVSRQLVQQYLAEIGIEAEIEPTFELGTTLISQDYDIVLFGWSGSPLFTASGSQYWGGDSGSNFGGYQNDEVDQLIEQARQAGTLAESATIHDQMMEIVVEEAYVLPLYDVPVYSFVTDEFVNVRDNANASLRALYAVHEWGLAAG